MLLSAAELAARRQLASAALSPLADSLAADLAPLVNAPAIYVPDRKARLTRTGGRCPRCGRTLEFNPWTPHVHHCSHCALEVTGDDHDGMWIMWYQLWLAERAVHAAALSATRGDPSHRALADGILQAYVERYLTYPNRDNVLGPTRVFFSTYLESIWSLQLACALDLLESSAGADALGAAVRERILAPSVALIAQFDEGRSNRQVWNNAALLAGSRLLGNQRLLQRALDGLFWHLAHALLPDGTWYEGENYHLFAHRGLWYCVTLADAMGVAIPEPLRERYRRGFATPFLTALPDFTFPSRRDSQYKISLRQWRIAESCELGVAEAPSRVLDAALRELYRSDIPRTLTGRDRSTAEAERNMPGSRLTRADLGWKALLFAPAATNAAADLQPAALPSVLLPDQGYAVLRRNAGRTYIALDYGESGGGHGHPDRLNLWLVVGDARILEDVGTGSYVDASLHWYRSSLAHNAPLAMARSQQRVDGELLCYDEQGDFGWVLARADVTPNVDARRAVLAGPDYLVDELTWSGPPDSIIDLPYHVAAAASTGLTWYDAPFPGSGEAEDGFRYIERAARSAAVTTALLQAELGGVRVRLWLAADDPFVLWRLLGPGLPNESLREFFVARFEGIPGGRLRTVIDWSASVAEVRAEDDALVVRRADGSHHVHSRRRDEWRVETGTRAVITLAGRSRAPHAAPSPRPSAQPPRSAIRVPRVHTIDPTPGAVARNIALPAARVQLAAGHYRRSEASWEEAGRPTAIVALALLGDQLEIDVAVHKLPLVFASAGSDNPLDNEHPDVNSDGVQLHGPRCSWLLVPEQDVPNVRITPRQGAASAPRISARWRPEPAGYSMRIAAPVSAFLDPVDGMLLDVIVNEVPLGRERRRGQLVLSGGRDEWVYLRGDRQPSSHLLVVTVGDA